MIERFFIQNFRCFHNFSIDFTDCPSALIIGRNGAGKSTLRDALRLLQVICRGGNRTREWIKASDFTSGNLQAPLRLLVELVLKERRFKYQITVEWLKDENEARIIDESLEADGVTIFTRQHEELAVREESTWSLNGQVAALPILADRRGDNSLHLVRTYFANLILISPIPANISGYSEKETSELQPDASNFAAWLNTLLIDRPKAYAVMEDYLKFVLRDFESFENVARGPNGRHLRVTFTREQPTQGVTLDFDQLSDGEKCYFLSAAIVAANKVRAPVFCFWDEPDNHLAISEVTHFIIHLRRMVNHNGQFVATTHSSKVIHAFSDENTFVFTRDSHLATSVARKLQEFSYRGDLIAALSRDEIIGDNLPAGIQQPAPAMSAEEVSSVSALNQ